MSSHLTARVYTLHGLAGEGVPESNIPIRSAAAAGQQPVVVGGPGDGLHRGHVVAVGLHGRGLSAARPGPYKQLVVVTPAGKVLAVGGPLEAAHLLPVAHQPPLRCNTRGSDVSLEYKPVPAAGAEQVPVPCEG